MRAFLLGLLISISAIAGTDTCSSQQKQDYLATAEARLDRLELKLEEWQTTSPNASNDILAKTASELALTLRDTRGDLGEVEAKCSDEWEARRDKLNLRVAQIARDIKRLQQGILAE